MKSDKAYYHALQSLLGALIMLLVYSWGSSPVYAAAIGKNNDGIPGSQDNCPYDYNPAQLDSDRIMDCAPFQASCQPTPNPDGVGDACDTVSGSLYYTFYGTVSEIESDEAGAVAASGLEVDDPIYFVVLMDFDQPGSFVYNSGDVHTYDDPTSYDLFFADYIEGSALMPVDGGYQTGPTDTFVQAVHQV